MEYKASDEDNKMFVHFTTLGFQADNIFDSIYKTSFIPSFLQQKGTIGYCCKQL